MPTKIPFRVIHASGQDETYKAIELNSHSPTTKGWQSSRFCLFPQDIVIQLEKRSRLRKIQILSHQYLITTKIEFYVGDVPNGMHTNLQNARYTRLGYVALSDNAKTHFKARELKSVHVDAIGCFVKFVIHKNHINKHNIYNQIGLVAMNVIGDVLSTSKALSELDLRRERSTELDESGKRDFISPLDDLAFDMYQDPEVAGIIRKLEKKKQETVLQERYDFAKKIKDAIATLQKVGEKLGKFEVEKRQAVESEDYDKAKLKKTQMDEYRLQIYNQLELEDLFEIAGTRHPSKVDLSPVRQPTPPRLTQLQDPPLPPPSPDDTQHTTYDERPLPAIKSKSPQDEPELAQYEDRPIRPSKKSDAEPETPDDDAPAPSPGEPEEMSSQDMRDAAGSIDVFDLPLVSKAYSKMWSFREEALSELQGVMMALNKEAKDESKVMMRAAIVLVIKGLKDKVYAVFTSAVHVLRYILTDYISKHKIPKSDVAYAVEKTLHPLLQKSADTAVRNRDLAKQYIVEESKFPEVKALNVITTECVKPFKLSISPRLALSRTEIVESLYQEHGLQINGLSVHSMMKFCTQALQHTSGEVRDKNEKIIVSLYKECGAPVKSYLPPDDDMTRKNVLYKKLFEAFDRIDGKPSKEELKKRRQEQEDEKAKEIDTLQHQLQALKDMTSGKVESVTAVKPVDDALLGEPEKKKNSKLPRKPVKKEKSAGMATDAGDDDISTIFPMDRTCIFCAERDEGFTEEGLDLHYWKSCPMLKRCTLCKQVVELAGLSEHYINECEAKNTFSRCPRCTESISNQEFEQHVAENSCLPAESGKSHCPLCHRNFALGEEAWKNHLMGKDGCKANPRRLQSINRKQAAGSKKTGAKTKGTQGSKGVTHDKDAVNKVK